MDEVPGNLYIDYDRIRQREERDARWQAWVAEHGGWPAVHASIKAWLARAPHPYEPDDGRFEAWQATHPPDIPEDMVRYHAGWSAAPYKPTVLAPLDHEAWLVVVAWQNTMPPLRPLGVTTRTWNVWWERFWDRKPKECSPEYEAALRKEIGFWTSDGTA